MEQIKPSEEVSSEVIKRLNYSLPRMWNLEGCRDEIEKLVASNELTDLTKEFQRIAEEQVESENADSLEAIIKFSAEKGIDLDLDKLIKLLENKVSKAAGLNEQRDLYTLYKNLASSQSGEDKKFSGNLWE